ncbi:MAG: fibrillarin-like rRNA/tRNA 2'-O-methyltransferase [Candidatus Diapherotrites archaeon]|nr:fibrillarin-like rRNA/tRNA 2'-O-methyltransferase [Candidatus Diapherotrites archaeon]
MVDLGFQKILEGVFLSKGKLCTLNSVPGMRVYGENLFTDSGKEYREWDIRRSKLAAGLKKGLRHWPFNPGISVLYLGSAEGTTCSHVSDIVGPTGLIFGVDISARVMRKFLLLCETRKNLVPLMASANHPEKYSAYIKEKVDVVFQDVSQKNQAEIFTKNCKQFLKKEGFGFLVIKSRSIDVSKAPKKVFAEQKRLLEPEFKILQEMELFPYEKDHAMFVVQLK